MATREGIIAELKKRGYNGPEVQGQQNPELQNIGNIGNTGMTGNQSIDDLISNALTPAMNYNKRMIGEPTTGNIDTLLKQARIYHLLNPSKTTIQKENYVAVPKDEGGFSYQQATDQSGNPITGSIHYPSSPSPDMPTPEGYLNIGGKIVKDPSFITPEQQRKIEADKERNDANTQSIIDTATQNLQSIGKAKEGSKYFGPLGNLPTIWSPSTLFGEYGPRKEWENNINQLLSQKVVDLITQMKHASRTGATGFGQLSDKEGKILREASTALSKDLPPDRALYYLNEMEKINNRILGGQQGNQQTGAYQAGHSRVINGVTYVRDDKGQWHPQS